MEGKSLKETKAKAKSDSDDETLEAHNSSLQPLLIDSDDDVGNEDLSLEIVQKAIAHAAAARGVGSVSAVDGSDELLGSKVVKKKIVKVRKKKSVKKVDSGTETVTMTKEALIVGISKDDEVVNIPDTDDGDNSENIILRRLLRGPRYFDLPDKSWGACYNCGEEGHSTANCTSARRKKPCFVCGSLEHEARQCKKGCFLCKGGGHYAKDCPTKYKRGSQGSEVCLKCGALAHAMSFCINDYSRDDLKEIQCYVCKRFGHLSCADYSHTLPSETSCYKCGHLGHNGQECRGTRGETSTGTPSSCFRCGEEGHFARECTNSVKEFRGTQGETSTGTPNSCYKCGEEGHFARECTNSVKARKRTRDLSTPTGKRPKDNKGKKGLRSAPHDLRKVHKKKKLQFEYDDGSPERSSKSKRRGGWITDDPRDFPREKNWMSPSTPNTKHKIYSLTNSGKNSYSKSPKKWSKYSSGTPSSQGYAKARHQSYSSPRFGNSSNEARHQSYPASRFGNSSNEARHQSYSASRFGNSSNDGMRRNYDWW